MPHVLVADSLQKKSFKVVAKTHELLGLQENEIKEALDTLLVDLNQYVMMGLPQNNLID